jgi:TPR repeat protein
MFDLFNSERIDMFSSTLVKQFNAVIFTLLLAVPLHGGTRSRNINFSAGTKITADSEFIADQKLIMTAGEEFCGNGYLEAPEIEISTKNFTFTGTIKCDGICTIITEAPFNHAMFKQEGKGEFAFKTRPVAAQGANGTTTSQSKVGDDQNKGAKFLEQAIKYRDGDGVAQDEKKSAEYSALAAAEGDLDAITQLGVYYCEGTGVEKNPQKGVGFLSKAAEKEHTFALYYLGVCYVNGNGAKKDAQKALELFLKSAEKGCVDAVLAIAQCYCYGIGVKKDVYTARVWLSKPSWIDMTPQQRDLHRKIQHDSIFGV